MIKNASLVVVGTGIKFLSHLTVEARAYIEQSDKVLFLVNDPGMKQWISKTNPQSESLDFLYSKFSLRKYCYQAITEYILQTVKEIKHVCVVLYGHPCVFAQIGIDAVNLAKKEGFYAKLLPGISSADCLFSDLLIDPGSHGCHSFEATDFLLYKRKFDPRSHLILYQADIIGVLGNPRVHNNKKGAELLIRYLSDFYTLNHKVILYEAAQYPSFEAKIEQYSLGSLMEAAFSRITTLYIPPCNNNEYDHKMLEELGINAFDL